MTSTPHAAQLREALEYALKHITILDVREHIQQALSLPSPSAGLPHKEWEYKRLDQFDISISGRLAIYGKNGWEMCGIIPTDAGSVHYYFKRPLPTPPETPRES